QEEEQANQAVNSAVQAVIQSIRDRIRTIQRAAPAAGPAEQPALWTSAVWGSAAVDHQDTKVAGVDTWSKAATWIGGGDITKMGIFHRSDPLRVGAFSGDTQSFASMSTKANTASVGVFTAYTSGGFSADFTYTKSFTDTSMPMAASTDSD